MTDLLDLLESIANNPHPLAADDQARILAAVKADRDANWGYIDPNRVRAALSNAHGLTVHPQTLSATYSSLRARGLIAFDHWGTNDDTRGGNAGKPQRIYRWIGATA